MVGFENRIFRKSFSFDRKKDVLTTEIHFRSYFHFKWFPERERERGRRGSPDHTFPSSSPTIARTKSHRSHRSQHRVDRTAPLDLAFDLASAQSRLCAISPSTHESSTHQSLSMWFWFLCDFDFCCCCGGVVVVFWWLWLLIAEVYCRGLNWSFDGVWHWDLAVICSMD